MTINSSSRIIIDHRRNAALRTINSLHSQITGEVIKWPLILQQRLSDSLQQQISTPRRLLLEEFRRTGFSLLVQRRSPQIPQEVSSPPRLPEATKKEMVILALRRRLGQEERKVHTGVVTIGPRKTRKDIAMSAVRAARNVPAAMKAVANEAAQYLSQADQEELLSHLQSLLDDVKHSRKQSFASEDYKQVARQAAELIFGKGDLDKVNELYAPNHVLRDPSLRAVEGVKDYARVIRSAFPDAFVTIEDQVAEGNKVMTAWTVTGTHRGDFLGVRPTGRRIKVSGITINRFSDGKIADDWHRRDDLGMLWQFGIPRN